MLPTSTMPENKKLTSTSLKLIKNKEIQNFPKIKKIIIEIHDILHGALYFVIPSPIVPMVIHLERKWKKNGKSNAEERFHFSKCKKHIPIILSISISIASGIGYAIYTHQQKQAIDWMRTSTIAFIIGGLAFGTTTRKSLRESQKKNLAEK